MINPSTCRRPACHPAGAVVLVAALAALLAGGCASTGGSSTVTYPADRPPFYRGDAPPARPLAPGRVAVLPVRLDLPQGVPAAWLPVDELERLAGDLTTELVEEHGLRLWDDPALPPGEPHVYLGCALDPAGECGDDDPEMVIAVTGARRVWRDALAGELPPGTDYLLVPSLALSEHWLRMKDWRGRKEVRLGTGYSQPVPWLTSLETPLQVIQVTGVLVDRDGRVVRAGAEGLLALRTGLLASSVGWQRVLASEDVEHVRRALRREDLPDRPRVWQAATDALVGALLGER